MSTSKRPTKSTQDKTSLPPSQLGFLGIEPYQPKKK